MKSGILNCPYAFGSFFPSEINYQSTKFHGHLVRFSSMPCDWVFQCCFACIPNRTKKYHSNVSLRAYFHLVNNCSIPSRVNSCGSRFEQFQKVTAIKKRRNWIWCLKRAFMAIERCAFEALKWLSVHQDQLMVKNVSSFVFLLFSCLEFMRCKY